MTRDPVELADAFLDGELPADRWEAAHAADPAGCDRALAAARAQRAVLASLARPALPIALRQRILAATSAAPATVQAPTAAGQPWWRYALPAALAAGLVLAVWLPTRSGPTPTASSAPAVARLEEAESTLTKDAEPHAEARRAGLPVPSASVLPPVSLSPLSDESSVVPALDAVISGAKKDGASAAQAAGESVAVSTPMTLPAPAPGAGDSAGTTAAPGPIVLQLAWRNGRDIAHADALERKRADTTTLNEALTKSSPAAAAESAAADQAEEPPAAHYRSSAPPARGEAGTADRELVITLRNQTVGDLRIAAGGIRLVGVAGDGRAVWRRTLRSSSETVIPAGRSLGWAQPIAVLPPGIERLRLEVDGQRSTEIEP